MALAVENSGVKHYTKIIHITILTDLDFLCEVTLCVKMCHMCVAARRHGILWNCSDGASEPLHMGVRYSNQLSSPDSRSFNRWSLLVVAVIQNK